MYILKLKQSVKCQPQLILDYEINFQDCKFLISFFFFNLLNQLSNWTFVILYYVLGCC